MKEQSEYRLGTQAIVPLILSMSAPIMFTLFIQAMYNIVDSVCVSAYSEHGLTAISLAFPLQLILTAVGNGTGTGAGILISHALGMEEKERAAKLVGNGLSATLINWLLALMMLPWLSTYYNSFSETAEVIRQGREYAGIVIALSLFTFVESTCTRMIQAKGNTVSPMRYQALGAVLNIVLDPIMIFGLGPVPRMGIRGAALATVIGQAASMFCAVTILFRQPGWPRRPRLEGRTLLAIYQSGMPTILTSVLVSVYITGLNVVLVQFSEDAVTALGIYYKIQSFLLIPLYGLEVGLMPIFSYNIGANNNKRVWDTFWISLALATGLTLLGTLLINLFLPGILTLLSAGPSLRATATPALRIISTAFPWFGVTILIPALLQANHRYRQCLCIVILRQVVLLVPIAALLSRFGLIYVWLTFPISEIIAAIVSVWFLILLRRAVPKCAQ